jgi:hypothetical protein
MQNDFPGNNREGTKNEPSSGGMLGWSDSTLWRAAMSSLLPYSQPRDNQWTYRNNTSQESCFEVYPISPLPQAPVTKLSWHTYNISYAKLSWL